jgi:hypothetical protein
MHDARRTARDDVVVIAGLDRGLGAGVRLERLVGLHGLLAVDVAEAFRDLPGLALLESARPGRRGRWTYLSADPLAVLESPTPGADPFAGAWALLARAGRPGQRTGTGRLAERVLPPFRGGLIGYVGYDVGRRLERLPSIARDDVTVPPIRLALHDWVIALDRATSGAWLAGLALDSDFERLERRFATVRDRLTTVRGRFAATAPDRRCRGRGLSANALRARGVPGGSRGSARMHIGPHQRGCGPTSRVTVTRASPLGHPDSPARVSVLMFPA